LAQATVIDQASRHNVLCAGRRIGKTTLGIDRAVTPDSLPYPVGWFSPTYKMMLEVWREAAEILKPITKRKNVQERRIENIAGGVLEFWSLDNPDAARGRKYARVIVDEAAMVPNLMTAWHHVIRPSLADFKGGSWFFSTPKGRNAFWQMYQWGQDEQMPEWMSWQLPTTANPFIPDSEIDEMRREMPELIYRQEILAQFVDDAGGVFRRVMDAATAEALDGPQEGRQYIAGVDVASKVDFTVVSIFDVAARRQAHLERFNRVDYNVLEDRLVALYERFGLDVMTIEDNSIGQGVIDHLRGRGLAIQQFHTSHTTKQQIIQGLAAAFEHSEIEILNDPIQVAELQAYEGKRMEAGGFKYSAPEGMHDDTVMAMAIAWHGLARAGDVVLW
jgi:hypothetical protein